MSYLANCRIILKLNNSVLVQKRSSSLSSNINLKIKSYDANLELHMSYLANCRIILKLNNSVLVQNMMLTVFFPLKKYLFGTVKWAWNTIKSKFTYNGWRIASDGVGS